MIGEPGVGKSRLFYEFIDSPATNGCTILETAAVSFGKLNAYFPLRELLKTFFQIEDSDATDTIRQKVAAKLTDLDSSLSAVLPALLALLDVSLEDPTWRELDPGQRRQRMLDAVKRLLIRLSQTQPLIVMVENLHWIDVETQAFLDNLSKDPKKLTRIAHVEYMREAGAEGIEMVMWLIMRGALDDKVDEVYRFYTVPASNTAVGHIILENKRKAAGRGTRPAGKIAKIKRAAARKKIDIRRG